MRDLNIDITLIYKKMEGQINAEENRLFEEWLQDNEHQKFFNNIQEYYHLQHEPYIQEAQTDIAWKKLEKRINTNRHSQKRHTLTTYIAAASIVLMLATIPLWINRHKSQTNTTLTTEILPGKYSAILELADGRSLNLNQLSQDHKTQIAAHISIDSNRLSYRHRTKDENLTLEFNKVTIPRGGEFQLILADSTKVWLNSESELKFPVAFGPDKREIYLEGEAYFEVSKDSKRPFTVYTGNQKVTVLGTSFGITSYPKENYETTTLVEGSVNVEFSQQPDQIYTLTPGFQVRYNRELKEIIREKVSTDEYVAWKDGKYVFKKKRLEDMLNTLSRWYDFQVFYQNHECKDILFSGEIQRFENFNSILNLLRKSSDADFTIHGNTILVHTKL